MVVRPGEVGWAQKGTGRPKRPVYRHAVKLRNGGLHGGEGIKESSGRARVKSAGTTRTSEGKGWLGGGAKAAARLGQKGGRCLAWQQAMQGNVRVLAPLTVS